MQSDDEDGFCDEKEFLSAGIEREDEQWSPVVLIFEWIKDEADKDGVFRSSIKRLALRSGMDIQSVSICVLHLVSHGALKIEDNRGLRIMMDSDELSRRLFKDHAAS